MKTKLVDERITLGRQRDGDIALNDGVPRGPAGQLV